MKKNYDQLNFEFMEPRKISIYYKLISTGLSLTLIAIPLVKILPGIGYIHNIYDYCIYGCLIPIGNNCFPFF